jgi:hypothetical protein
MPDCWIVTPEIGNVVVGTKDVLGANENEGSSDGAAEELGTWLEEGVIGRDGSADKEGFFDRDGSVDGMLLGTALNDGSDEG